VLTFLFGVGIQFVRLWVGQPVFDRYVFVKLHLTFGLAAVLAFIACPAGTEAQFINKMLKFSTNV